MATRSTFIDDVLDRLAPLGIRARGVFSGHGLYDGPVMMGMIVDDRLYFKTGDANRAAYEAAGMEPYRYGRSGGRRIAMSYHEVPPAAFDDPEMMLEWARTALDVARAAKAGVPAKRPSRAASRRP